MKKIGEIFSGLLKKFVDIIPFLDNFIKVKIAADDLPAIQNALTAFESLCNSGAAFARTSKTMLADNELTLEEMELLARGLKVLAGQAGDVVDAVRDAG